MLVREFLKNPKFEVNCFIKIYDCTENPKREASNLIYNGFVSPTKISENIFDMEISHVSTDDLETIVLEVKKVESKQKHLVVCLTEKGTFSLEFYFESVPPTVEYIEKIQNEIQERLNLQDIPCVVNWLPLAD